MQGVMTEEEFLAQHSAPAGGDAGRMSEEEFLAQHGGGDPPAAVDQMNEAMESPEFLAADPEQQQVIRDMFAHSNAANASQEYDQLKAGMEQQADARAASSIEMGGDGIPFIDEHRYQDLVPGMKERANRLINENVAGRDFRAEGFAKDLDETGESESWAARTALQTTAGIGSTLKSFFSRITGDQEGADQAERDMGQLEQAIDERQANDFQRMATGAASSLGKAAYAGAAGGPAGMIGTFMYDAGSRAYAETGDVAFALSTGLIEGGITAAFQRAGLGGLEKGIKGFRGAGLDGLKKFGRQLFAEVAEEEAIGLAQAFNSAMQGVDPDSLKKFPDQALKIAGQTLLTMGAAKGMVQATDFLSRPSYETAKEAGVDKVATTQKQRVELAEKVKNALTGQQFREQLNAAATSQEEADALYSLVEARAETAGESVDDYVGRRIKGIELTEQGKSVALNQGIASNPRGEIVFLNDGRAIIRAFQGSQDATTLAHEMGHLFRRDLADADLSAAEKWAKVKEGKWTRAAEEQFARGFERYLRDGIAPTPKLRQVFEHYKDWLSRVYQKLKGSPLASTIPPEMRQVYDNLFTPQQQEAAIESEAEPAPEPLEGEVEDAAPPVEEEIEGEVLRQGRGSSPTSLKNATVDEEREARGLPPMMTPARLSNPEAWDNAMRKIDSDPAWQDRLTAELAENPRAVTPEENAGLLHKKVSLRNEHFNALDAWQAAQQKGDVDAIAEAEQRVTASAAKLADFDDVDKAIGTESGRSLQARKMMADEDFSLVKMELEARVAKGRDLTPEERQEIIDLKKKIDELQAKLDEKEASKEAIDEAKAVDEAMAETKREATKEARKRKPRKAKEPDPLTPEDSRPGAKRRPTRRRKSKEPDLKSEIDATLSALKTIIEKGQTNEIHTDLQKLARYFWQQGIREREPMVDALHEAISPLMGEGWTRQLTQRAFSGYGQFKPLSKDEITAGLADLKTQTQQVLKIEALENKKPLEKTGLERRPLTDAARRLVKQVNELKKKYGVVVTDPAKQLKSALEARKTYYKHRLADLKHEIDTRQRIVKDQTPSPSDPELDAMIAEHQALKQDHDAIFGKKGLTDDQRLSIALKAARRAEAEWTQRLADAKAGKFKAPTPRPGFKSFVHGAVKSRTAALKQQVKELEALSKPKKSPEEIALQSLKTRMANETLKLEEKLAKGDFTAKERKATVLDEEGAKIKAELDMVRAKYRDGLERDRWARKNVWEKGRRYAANSYDLIRAIMATGEMSFVLRQGKGHAVAHPIKTIRNVRDALRAFKNEKTALAIENQMLSHPLYSEARMDKLHFSEPNSSLTRMEEDLVGRLTDRTPGLAGIARATRVFLNKTRFDIYLALRKSASKSGTPTLEERRQFAMLANESTGRGGLGKWGEPAAVVAGRLFFSPRFAVSRFQMLLGHSMWGGTARSRRIIAQEYARMMIGHGLYLTLLTWALSDDEEKAKLGTDPSSSDFGKVIIGKTRLDTMAGLSQVTTLLSRTKDAAVAAAKGDDSQVTAIKNWRDTASQFMWGKVHPTINKAADILSQRDLGGNRVTPRDAALDTGPITWFDIYEALQDHGMEKGSALSLLAFFGEGLQSYDRKKR